MPHHCQVPAGFDIRDDGDLWSVDGNPGDAILLHLPSSLPEVPAISWYAEPHWIRGVFYIVLGAVLITVSNEVDHHAAGWSFGIFLPINGLLYLVASLRGEPTSTDKDDEKRGTEFSDIGRAERGDGGTGRDEARQGGSALENAAKEMASDPGVQKAAFTAMKNNPGLAKEALKAAAKV
eukprot:CAMPEP_0184304222 /NCGR_PEP_ID=MMETSP1049-20130417/13797_1 /TAXON_ID=77928 /ORGANISM="Proteomonas sulcata, Strain CCMP704" /LENGTH=178 /DNA_ID=CAMNT_0026615981 /DNA_START=150 /DNA_END=687 /DNA_ORIENTATION=-